MIADDSFRSLCGAERLARPAHGPNPARQNPFSMRHHIPCLQTSDLAPDARITRPGQCRLLSDHRPAKRIATVRCPSSSVIVSESHPRRSHPPLGDWHPARPTWLDPKGSPESAPTVSHPRGNSLRSRSGSSKRANEWSEARPIFHNAPCEYERSPSCPRRQRIPSPLTTAPPRE